LSGAAILLLGGIAQGAVKTDAAKIANALSAAPPAVSRDASVVEMTEDGSMKALRKGKVEIEAVA